MSIDLPSQINTELGGLPLDDQQCVLDYVLALKRTRKGTLGSVLKRHAGSLAPNEAKLMRDAIEAGCEQVDSDGW